MVILKVMAIVILVLIDHSDSGADSHTYLVIATVTVTLEDNSILNWLKVTTSTSSSTLLNILTKQKFNKIKNQINNNNNLITYS